MRHQRHHSNGGGALISALFITAICAIIATALAVRGGVLIREGELVKNGDQTYLNLQRVQDWARDQIKVFVSQWVGLQGKPPATLRQMRWQFDHVKMGNKTVSGAIFDAQAHYNLNNLVLTASQPQFAALVMAVAPAVPQKKAYQLAQAITDWMTKGKLDTIYLKRKPAYRAPKHQMADKTELRLVAGMSAALYQKLSPYIVALPVQVSATSTVGTTSGSSDQAQTAKLTAININSASWPVWMAVVPNLREEKAKALVACRKRYRYFTNSSDFTRECAQPLGISIPSSVILTAHSQYYLFDSEAVGRKIAIHFNSLLMSEVVKNNKIVVNIIRQSFY